MILGAVHCPIKFPTRQSLAIGSCPSAASYTLLIGLCMILYQRYQVPDMEHLRDCRGYGISSLEKEFCGFNRCTKSMVQLPVLRQTKISFIDAKSRREFYGKTANMPKDPAFYGIFGGPDNPHIFVANDSDHARMRYVRCMSTQGRIRVTQQRDQGRHSQHSSLIDR